MSSGGQRPDSEPPLPTRDVSIFNVAVAATQNQAGELIAEIERALRIGVTPDEIRAILDQVVLLVGNRVIDSIWVAEQWLSDLEQ